MAGSPVPLVPESLATSSPFVVFLAVLLGVLLGQVEYRGFTLGVSGVLFAGLGLGLAGFEVEHAYFVLSLVLFIAAVGLLAGEDIGDVFRTYGPKFVAIGVLMTAVAAGFTNFCVMLFGAATDPWIIRGTFAGAVSSSPGLAAALEVTPEAFRRAVSAGYAVSYPVGILAIILFEQLAPQMAGLDLEAERRRFAATIGQTRAVTPGSPPSTSVPFSLAGFSLAIVLGAVVGIVPVPLGPLGSVTLDVTGGTLVAALVIGHLRAVGPIETRMSRTVLTQIREVSIGIFLAVVGVETSARFVEAASSEGVFIVASALIIGVGTMVLGFVMAVAVWDLDWIAASGAITGGMTSTPGLGAAINATGTEEVAASYGATYPFALLAKVIFSKILVVVALGAAGTDVPLP